MKNFILLSLLLSAFVFGCSKERPAVTQPQTVSVTTASVEARDVPDTLEVVGTIESKREAVLSAKLMGAIRELPFDEGQRVRHGDAVVVIDASEIKAKKEEAEQARQEGLASANEADAALAEARAALENAKVNLDRMQNLYNEAAVTKKELDDMSTHYKMAEAKVRQADARRHQVKARIAQAEAGIAQADALLSYAVIRSPLTGVVTQKMAQVGEMAAPGRPLVKVVDDVDLRLAANVKESGISGLKRGQTVSVKVDALPGASIEGTVSEIVTAADPKTRSFTVKVNIPWSPGLMPGMFGRLYLPSGTRKAVLLPEGSLLNAEGVQGVYVVASDGTIAFQAVRLGGSVEGKREALSGLKGGEKVATGDLGRISEGMKAKR